MDGSAIRRLRKRLVYLIPGVLLILVPSVYRVGLRFNWFQPLSRPHEVSASARYAATLKNSAWFDCRHDTKRNVNPCKVWREDGKVIANGDYRLEGKNRAADLAELKPSAVGGIDEHGRRMIYLRTSGGKTFGPRLLQVDNFMR